MTTAPEMRALVLSYARQHLYILGKDQDPALAEAVTDALVAANDGMLEAAAASVDAASGNACAQTLRTWKTRLRLLVSAYLHALRDEMAGDEAATAAAVIADPDRAAQVRSRAAVIARSRRKHLNGWTFFADAA